MHETLDVSRHPEGLTETQESLVNLLYTTQIEAPVIRRITLPDGTYDFRKIIRPMSPIAFAQDGEFALKLHEKNPGAPLSPIYINLRNLPEEIVDQIGLTMSEVATSEQADFCTGIPKAGIPLAVAYSHHSAIPFVEDVFRKGQTDMGRKILAVGEKRGDAGSRLRLIDDLVTHADTKIEAIEAAKQMGYQVTDVVVLIDRQESACTQLAEAGCTLYSVMKINQILMYGLRIGHISPEQYDKVRSYLGLSN
jgi:orotate phosphoribosyltransferase